MSKRLALCRFPWKLKMMRKGMEKMSAASSAPDAPRAPLESMQPEHVMRVRELLGAPDARPALQLLFEGKDEQTFLMLATNGQDTRLKEIKADSLDAFMEQPFAPCPQPVSYATLKNLLKEALLALGRIEDHRLPSKHRRVVFPGANWDGRLGARAFAHLHRNGAMLRPQGAEAIPDDSLISARYPRPNTFPEEARQAVLLECTLLRFVGPHGFSRDYQKPGPFVTFEFIQPPFNRMQDALYLHPLVNRTIDPQTPTGWRSEYEPLWHEEALAELLCPSAGHSQTWLSMILKPAGRPDWNCQRVLARVVMERPNALRSSSKRLGELFRTNVQP